MVRLACILFLSLVSSAGCAWAQESPTTIVSAHTRQTRAAAVLARANVYTNQAEERIRHLPPHLQPVAWARLFAVWYESGYRSELRRLRDDPAWQDVDPDKELDCGNIPDPWLKSALGGIVRRSETMQARRQRMVSAAYVLEILAPLGKGVTSCVLIEMQSKTQDKRSIKDWPKVMEGERALFQSVAGKLGSVAEAFARNDTSFDRAVELAHTIIKLRSAAPLDGFLNAAREKATEDVDNYARNARQQVLQEAVDSMELDPDPIFAAELGTLLFSITADTEFAPHQARYAALLPAVLDAAAGNEAEPDELCDLANVAGQLRSYLPNLSSSALSTIQYCAQAALADGEWQIGPGPSTVDEYVAAAKSTGDPARRAAYKMAGARLALQQQHPILAVELAMSVTPEERRNFPGSWRLQTSTVAIEAAKMLHTIGDSPGLERLWVQLPDAMRAPVQIALAMDALDKNRSPEFVHFMLRLAYRTLEHFETDDSEALIAFANGFARALPADARLAYRDAIKWLDHVPHPPDPWRDRDLYQRERSRTGTPRDEPAPLGREFKPAPFHEAIVLVRDLEPEVAISAISDVSDQVSLYLGLTQAALALAKRLDATKPVDQR